MGVMSCSRYRCDNILCNTYVPGEIGYICEECQKEFKKYLDREGIKVTTIEEIRIALTAFLETQKGSYDKEIGISVEDFFKNYTKEHRM